MGSLSRTIGGLRPELVPPKRPQPEGSARARSPSRASGLSSSRSLLSLSVSSVLYLTCEAKTMTVRTAVVTAVSMPETLASGRFCSTFVAPERQNPTGSKIRVFFFRGYFLYWFVTLICSSLLLSRGLVGHCPLAVNHVLCVCPGSRSGFGIRERPFCLVPLAVRPNDPNLCSLIPVLFQLYYSCPIILALFFQLYYSRSIFPALTSASILGRRPNPSRVSECVLKH